MKNYSEWKIYSDQKRYSDKKKYSDQKGHYEYQQDYHEKMILIKLEKQLLPLTEEGDDHLGSVDVFPFF